MTGPCFTGKLYWCNLESQNYLSHC